MLSTITEYHPKKAEQSWRRAVRALGQILVVVLGLIISPRAFAQSNDCTTCSSGYCCYDGVQCYNDPVANECGTYYCGPIGTSPSAQA